VVVVAAAAVASVAGNRSDPSNSSLLSKARENPGLLFSTGVRYCENCDVAERNDGPGPIGGVRSYALDPARARALWARTEEWVKERFPLGE